jgi:hypothetical protein
MGLPMVGKKILHRDQRKRQPKEYTSHEVTAPRAMGPSGRTYLLFSSSFQDLLFGFSYP